MFKIGTFSDYPQVFQAGKIDYFLTSNELKFYLNIKGFNRRRGWMLKRLILKELTTTYLNETKKLWYPLNSIEIEKINKGNTYKITALMLDKEKPCLLGAGNICENHGVGFVFEYSDGINFSVKIDKVKNEFPFSLDESFSKDEELFIKSKNTHESNKYVTIFKGVKSILKELLPDEEVYPTITKVNHDDTIYLTPFDFDYDDYIFKFWEYNDYIIVFGGFFQNELREALMNQLQEWV